ncbi:hypothetical protein N9W00_01930 [Arcobacteraceae bacterium]|nr:hypothetical protein [Arcobacteraceae bacterium]
MKRNLGLASLLLAGSLYGASEDAGKWYVGVGTFNGSGTQTNTYSGNINTELTYGYDVSGMPITIGYVTATNNRAAFSIVSIDATADADGAKSTISGSEFNYNFTLESIGTEKLLPYIGFGLGIYTYENSGVRYGIVGNEDLNGVAFNVNLGVLYSITNNLEFEASYINKSIAWQEVQYLNANTNLSVTEDISGVYLGLNLKF